MFDGVAGDSAARADPQFVVERAHMGFDGEQANDELLALVKQQPPGQLERRADDAFPSNWQAVFPKFWEDPL